MTTNSEAPVPSELIHTPLEWIVVFINAATVLVLLWGVVCGLRQFLRTELSRSSPATRSIDRRRIRQELGFYLLYGLELLIAADVIETMIRPTLSQLAILGGVSLIRIVTGFALGRELEELQPPEESHGSA